ncbi:hypothetical protein EG68_00705 [Paragonimus skrjabini miyazakii]|uniref:Uncharacterized protein n=1 Tax=Paragonimus skrjabini miyazakii TaxID=59628 RepID=A0A8S9Z3E8_9TREM|nr:hypothetical protein EG68_00705 [Paragonimus skrjabini miyazakii]
MILIFFIFFHNIQQPQCDNSCAPIRTRLCSEYTGVALSRFTIRQTYIGIDSYVHPMNHSVATSNDQYLFSFSLVNNLG